jgi:hypothetical protein
MMVLSVQFDHCGRRFELRPAWPPSAPPPSDGFDREESTDVPAGPWPAVPRWLASCDTWRLRALAEDIDGGPGVLQQRDAQVHAAVTRLLQQGRLRLFELTHRPLRDEQKAELPRSTVPAFTPSMLRAPAPAEPTRQAAAQAKPPTPVIDQDQQAAVLRRAAENGTPFCEECERRRQERQRRVAELEPA